MWDLTDTFRVLGIQEFRTGRHIICDGNGKPLSEGVVTSIWKAVVRPSRQIRSVLIVAHFEAAGAGELVNYRTGVRGAYVTRGCNVISRIESDPVLELLRKSKPKLPKGISLDGISYDLAIESGVSYQIDFSNPIRGSRLHQIQCGLFQIASEIVDGAGNDAGTAAVKIWRRYIYPSRPE